MCFRSCSSQANSFTQILNSDVANTEFHNAFNLLSQIIANLNNQHATFLANTNNGLIADRVEDFILMIWLEF